MAASDKMTLVLAAFVILTSYCNIYSNSNHILSSSVSSGYHHPGDFILTGLFDDNDGCNSSILHHNAEDSLWLQRMAAMIYAVEVINKRTDILPNVTLGLETFNTCAKKSVALNHVVNQLMNNNCQNSEAKSWMTDSDHNNDTAIATASNLSSHAPIIGLIGAEWSSITTTVSPIFSTFHLPSLSYSSTSDALSNKDDFPYFMRVVPPDRHQIQAIFDVLHHFNWTSVSFVYTDDSYGRNALKCFKKFLTKEQNQDICIAEQFGVDDGSDYDDIVRSIVKHDHSRVVILFAHTVYATMFLESMHRMNANEELQLIGSDAWGSILNNLTSLASGTLKIRFVNSPVPEFETFFRSTRPIRHHWFSDDFLTGRRLLTKGFSKKSGVSRVIDSVLVYAYGLDEILRQKCPMYDPQCVELYKNNFNGTELLQSMKKLNFRGYSRYDVSFGSNGDEMGFYDIVNIQCSEDGQNMDDMDTDCDLVQVGTWSSTNRLNINDKAITWGVTTASQKYSDVPDSYCEGPPTYTEWSDPWAIVILILNCIGLLFTIIVALCYACNISHDLIRASGPESGYLVLFGVFLSYLLVFTFIAKPSTLTCYCIRIGYMLCFTTLNAPLLVHANAIFRRYRAVVRSTRRPGGTTPSSKIFFSLCLIMIQVSITLVFLIITPPETEILEPIPRQRELTCNTNHVEMAVSLVYNVLLIVLCSIHAFLTRNVPENFSESRFIGFSAYTTLVIWLFFIPSYIIVPFANLKVIILSAAMIVSASVSLIFLFAVKLYAVYFVHDFADLRISRPPIAAEKSWPGAAGGLSQEKMKSEMKDDRSRSLPYFISSNMLCGRPPAFVAAAGTGVAPRTAYAQEVSYRSSSDPEHEVGGKDNPIYRTSTFSAMADAGHNPGYAPESTFKTNSLSYSASMVENNAVFPPPSLTGTDHQSPIMVTWL